ncbi:MAG: rhomboid family intramembrane serine protease, partial [Akkermansiaceae bacterium]|nr:rhomboid family intramembrane serine protease [Akkermansiaceae bacterium]
MKWLLISNIAIFLVDLLYRPEIPAGAPRGYYQSSFLGDWGEFSIQSGIHQLQVWRFVTFQFLHADFLHVLFNMYAIYMFGRFAEQWWRSRPFLVYYLLCGVGGAVFYTILQMTGVLESAGVETALVGASAGVFGILIAVAVIAPEGRVMLLIPPIPMKMRTFALVFIVIESVIVLTSMANAGGSAGHLGGAAVGFLLMKVGPLRNLLLRLSQTVTVVKRPALVRAKPKRRRYERKLRPKSRLSKADASEVDRILDKINEHGLQSLTEEEREL